MKKRRISKRLKKLYKSKSHCSVIAKLQSVPKTGIKLRSERVHGVTWVDVYHSEPIDEAMIHEQYATFLDIEDGDTVRIEPSENAKKGSPAWGGDPMWLKRWDISEGPH